MSDKKSSQLFPFSKVFKEMAGKGMLLQLLKQWTFGYIFPVLLYMTTGHKRKHIFFCSVFFKIVNFTIVRSFPNSRIIFLEHSSLTLILNKIDFTTYFPTKKTLIFLRNFLKIPCFSKREKLKIRWIYKLLFQFLEGKYSIHKYTCIKQLLL